MDFVKVFDQAVREIKREVNLKVLKVPEIEQKVLDATNDEPWGPHGSALAELARETKKFTECQMIMNVLWTRLTDTGPNWRHVYKALTVIEYLIGNGSERAVDDIIEHGFQISSLSSFEYVEPNGKDMGINVRKKAETISGLLNDRDKIKAVRDKAAANRDKYVGLSSRGITYKSSASSFGSGDDFRQKDRYGETRVSREGETFSDSYNYKFKDQHTEEPGDRVSNNKGNTSKNGIAQTRRDKEVLSSSTSKSSSKQNSTLASKVSVPKSLDDEFDDFDPRGSSIPGSAAAGAKQVDLFGDSLLIDLMDAPAPIPTEMSATSSADPEVDLFADATFVSAPSIAGNSQAQETTDLFANPAASVSSKISLFSESDSPPTIATEHPRTVLANSESFDPFAQIPLNNFEDQDIYSAFTSSSETSKSEPPSGCVNASQNISSQPAWTTSNPPKKDTFQVKSGIWADSLSRGLIDLNISAPKKVSLADVGVVGLSEPSEDKGNGPFSSGYMAAPLGAGSGLGWPAFPTSMGAGSTAYNTNQQQHGSFK